MWGRRGPIRYAYSSSNACSRWPEPIGLSRNCVVHLFLDSVTVVAEIDLASWMRYAALRFSSHFLHPLDLVAA